MSEQPPRRRFLVLAGGVLLLVTVGFVVWARSSTEQNKRQELSTASQDDIYVRIPWHSGDILADPHWFTTFAELGLKNLASLEQLPTAQPTLDPWAYSVYPVRNIFLQPGDLSSAWSIAVGHGFVSVRIGKAIFLYYDTIGLEKSLLKQGIAHGFLTDMRTIFPKRDFSDLKPTDTLR